MLRVDQDRSRRMGLNDQRPAEFGQSRPPRQWPDFLGALGKPDRVDGPGKDIGVGTSVSGAPVDAVRFGDRLEAAVGVSGRLRIAEKQEPAVTK